MRSTRLPGKVLRHLGGRSVLSHVVERVRASRALDDVVVATTDRPHDEPIVRENAVLDVRTFRGSEEDVLARFHGAAHRADVVVRVTADCPLLDPSVLRGMVQRFHAVLTSGARLDYLSNIVERTFPRGLDAEVFTYAALDVAHREARAPFEREHVTPYIYHHPGRFVLADYTNAENLSHHRWTLDTEEDFAFLSEVFDALHREGEIFGTDTVLALLRRRPRLAALNVDVQQKPLGS